MQLSCHMSHLSLEFVLFSLSALAIWCFYMRRIVSGGGQMHIFVLQLVIESRGRMIIE